MEFGPDLPPREPGQLEVLDVRFAQRALLGRVEGIARLFVALHICESMEDVEDCDRDKGERSTCKGHGKIRGVEFFDY